MTVAGVLLAAGAGSRFSGDEHKLTVHLRGEPVVVHSLRSMVAAGFNQLVIVTGAVDVSAWVEQVAAETGRSIDVVYNPNWAEGQASSIQAALQFLAEAGHASVVVGLADQPDVGIAAWRVVGASHGVIVAATFDGKRRPPVKLDRVVWSDLPMTGDYGARLLMERHPTLVSEVPCPGDPSDIDTLEDLGRFNA